MTTILFCLWVLWISKSNGHIGDGWSLLHNVWGLSWEDSSGWGLEASGDFLAHISGTWAEMIQSLGSAGIVYWRA